MEKNIVDRLNDMSGLSDRDSDTRDGAVTYINFFRSALGLQESEDEVEGVFRFYILSFWSRERTIKFCLHLLGDEAQEWGGQAVSRET